MRRTVFVLSAILFASCAVLYARANSTQEKPASTEPKMSLELRDWRDAAALEKVTDGELFWIISNGKGKMPGEGDRTPEKTRWNFVNLVRSFAKKGAADKPKAETPPG